MTHAEFIAARAALYEEYKNSSEKSSMSMTTISVISEGDWFRYLYYNGYLQSKNYFKGVSTSNTNYLGANQGTFNFNPTDLGQDNKNVTCKNLYFVIPKSKMTGAVEYSNLVRQNYHGNGGAQYAGYVYDYDQKNTISDTRGSYVNLISHKSFRPIIKYNMEG